MNHRPDQDTKSMDDTLEALFQDVPARPRPPAGVEELIFKHFSEDWEKLQSARSRRKRVIY